MSTWFEAVLLGILEGLTEFLPVSSTGHLILAVDILKFAGPPGQVFEVSIQLGAILAVMLLYREKLRVASCELLHFGADRRTLNSGHYFFINLLLAFLPAAVLGLLFHSALKQHLFNPLTVAISLIAGGFAILLIERMKPAAKIMDVDAIGWQTALKIGFIQCIAMIPGVSRSGATILGAMLLGVERKAAAEFSFFLAIPTIGAASVYDLYKNWGSLNGEGLELIAIGFVAAFVSALVVIKPFVAFISRYGFAPFAWYRIAVGGIMLLFVLPL